MYEKEFHQWLQRVWQTGQAWTAPASAYKEYLKERLDTLKANGADISDLEQFADGSTPIPDDPDPDDQWYAPYVQLNDDDTWSVSLSGYALLHVHYAQKESN